MPDTISTPIASSRYHYSHVIHGIEQNAENAYSRIMNSSEDLINEMGRLGEEIKEEETLHREHTDRIARETPSRTPTMVTVRDQTIRVQSTTGTPPLSPILTQEEEQTAPMPSSVINITFAFNSPTAMYQRLIEHD